jgi:hypothetical protein
MSIANVLGDPQVDGGATAPEGEKNELLQVSILTCNRLDEPSYIRECPYVDPRMAGGAKIYVSVS